VTINRVLVRTWEATGRSILLLRNFGGEASSEAATRMTTKKVERLNENGPYGKLCELEGDASQWRSSARAFARGSGSFGLWYQRIRLG
jgi:type IV pilus biogenesis protein CpaD/CtpE